MARPGCEDIEVRVCHAVMKRLKVQRWSHPPWGSSVRDALPGAQSTFRVKKDNQSLFRVKKTISLLHTKRIESVSVLGKQC